MKAKFILLCGVLIFISKVNAAVKLPRLIDNGMVLQRNTVLTIWGWADEGEKVKLKFRDKEYIAPGTSTLIE